MRGKGLKLLSKSHEMFSYLDDKRRRRNAERRKFDTRNGFKTRISSFPHLLLMRIVLKSFTNELKHRIKRNAVNFGCKFRTFIQRSLQRSTRHFYPPISHSLSR